MYARLRAFTVRGELAQKLKQWQEGSKSCCQKNKAAASEQKGSGEAEAEKLKSY